LGSRRRGRELALQMLYQWDVARKPVEEIEAAIPGLQRSGEGALEFATALVRGTIERVEEIDVLIREHSERWRLERMPVVDRNLLRLAIYELLERATPAGVVINEALEVAKRFSSPDATSFLNGVLDAVSARLAAPGDEVEELGVLENAKPKEE
jgi:transcription antitermination protein NusB